MPLGNIKSRIPVCIVAEYTHAYIQDLKEFLRFEIYTLISFVINNNNLFLILNLQKKNCSFYKTFFSKTVITMFKKVKKIFQIWI